VLESEGVKVRCEFPPREGFGAEVVEGFPGLYGA